MAGADRTPLAGTIRIGLISDTHGLLRPEAVQALHGCAAIVHAGDIGGPAILEQLGALAPVTAVRGNNDHGAWAQALPEAVTLRLFGIVLHVLHDLARLAIEPSHEGVDVVVSGHSHRPLVESRGGVLYVNPGSAGPVRFRLPVCVALLARDEGVVRARVVDLLYGPIPPGL